MKCIHNIISRFSRIIPMIVAVGIGISSCTDEISIPTAVDGPEGEPAEISLTLSVGDMTAYTRASDDDDYRRVNSLWIGIYNATTGKRTFSGMMDSENNGFTAGLKDHASDYSLKGIKTKSGRSFIVAVANPENYTAMVAGAQQPEDNALQSILQNYADDWDKYKSIVVTGKLLQNGTMIDIEAPTVDDNSGLLMSGIYAAAGVGDPVSSETPAYIAAGTDKLTGRIHLRRLVSHINFSIKAGGDVVEIIPQSYQVHRAPYASWLHEHTASADILNAGDALCASYDDNQEYYKSSLVYSSTFISHNENEGTYSFDFWQMENKRHGLESSCGEYADREKEFGKTGEYKPSDADASYEGSGIFMSLSGFENPDLNNMATYVDIPCIVKYKEKTTDANAKPNDIPDDENNLPGDDNKYLDAGRTRTANITYRVHLGYVTPTDNAEANPDPRDFNCYRNSDYTYNMTVTNLHNVILEAFRKGENQPGGFGDVTDVTDEFYSLDAHYGVFNIYLTAEDIASFSYRMISYESNVEHEIKGEKGKNGEGSVIPVIDNTNRKFYNWIIFVYNDGITTPDASSDSQKRSIMAFPDTDAKKLYMNDFLTRTDLEEGWYTVFVNEYTYETGADESGTNPNWKTYVNQPNRMFWINVAQKKSADGASTFYMAKYAGSQRSIQTYYNMDAADCTTAVGVEHENENFGMNIRWTSPTGVAGLNPDNGRVNVWNSLPSGRSWDDCVSRTSWQKVGAITNTDVQNLLSDAEKAGGYRNVPQMSLLNYNSDLTDSSDRPAGIRDYRYDPQGSGADKQYVQAIYSCMNRNRDENGDGIITQNELKWYLPSSGKYLRVILGRNSLPSPIMSYNYSELPMGAASTGRNGIFHYISSDNKVVWADEGMSSSQFYQTTAPSATSTSHVSAPWQVRCIRNLGTDLSSVATGNNDGVTPAYAYTVNGTSAKIEVTHYLDQTLRNPTIDPLPVHKTNSPYNRLGRYGFEVAYCGNVTTSNNQTNEVTINKNLRGNALSFKNYLEASLTGDDVQSNPCYSLNSTSGRKGWRVPNQKELTIMMRLGILRITYTNYDHYVVSSTTEYWDDDASSATVNDLSKLRVAAAKLRGGNTLGMTQIYYNQEQKSGYTNQTLMHLRCVRDLQAGE